MGKEVWFLLDYDSCIGEINEDPKHPAPKNLYDANPKLNALILTFVNDEDVLKIILGTLSKRNFVHADTWGIKKYNNGCSYEHQEKYTLKLQTHSTKISQSTMLAQDFCLGKEPGYVWEKLKASDWSHKKKADKELLRHEFFGDETKIVLYFIHAWFAHRKKTPGSDLVLVAADDYERFLRKISEFFTLNPMLHPPGTKTQFLLNWHYIDDDGKEVVYKFDVLKDIELSMDNAERTSMDFDIYEAAIALSKLICSSDNPGEVINPLPQNLTIDALLGRKVLQAQPSRSETPSPGIESVCSDGQSSNSLLLFMNSFVRTSPVQPTTTATTPAKLCLPKPF